MKRFLALLAFVAASSVSGEQSGLIVKTQTLCSINFERDTRCPVRVDNEAKACLDDVALNLQRQADARLVIVGSRDSSEPSTYAGQRALATELYLVKEKGIAAARITILGNMTPDTRSVNNTLVPMGAAFSGGQNLETVPKSRKLPVCACHHCEDE